jgi:hypothetical protein
MLTACRCRGPLIFAWDNIKGRLNSESRLLLCAEHIHRNLAACDKSYAEKGKALFEEAMRTESQEDWARAMHALSEACPTAFSKLQDLHPMYFCNSFAALPNFGVVRNNVAESANSIAARWRKQGELQSDWVLSFFH